MPSVLALDALLDNPPHLLDLQDFLAEPDPHRALVWWLENFCAADRLKTATDIELAIHQAIVDIDHKINDQLNQVIHHPALQRLEASWRGLWYLVTQLNGARNAKIKVLDISWAEVVRDIGRALEFDQSCLFQKIYSDEYGTAGGEPYGVMLGDYQVRHKNSRDYPHDDIATLEGLAEIAAAAFTPFIAGASCELFGLDDFAQLRLPIDLPAIFAQKEYIRWRTLRTLADSRFIGLALPRTLMRRPYRTTPGSYKGVFFYEKLDSDGADQYCWGNACYAFGGVLLREFANVGWFGHIRGVPRDQAGGGLVTNLPCDSFATDPHPAAWKPSTDVVITDSLEREISNLGFIPLCQCYAAPFAAFYSNPSLQVLQRATGRDVDINARLAAMMQHVLCGSRIAHYIKVMIRDKIGSFMSAMECEDYLRRWLFNYTTGRNDLEWEAQARYPLREASVKVREHRDKPGHYQCVIHLIPHYQTDQMISELELVTELVQQGGGL